MRGAAGTGFVDKKTFRGAPSTLRQRPLAP